MMAKTSQDLPSKRHFHWTNKVATDDHRPPPPPPLSKAAPRRKLSSVAVSRLRSVVAAFSKKRSQGGRVVGTLFGCRRGHVHFAFQKKATCPPELLIELATPISGLVKEMASGQVRMALECEKREGGKKGLMEETAWRAYCNGKRCGMATRRACGEKEWKVLRAVEPISMGAGVLPTTGDGDGDGDGDGVMYMRAMFERVVGSADSEAYYMMNPDTNGAPELSLYFLRLSI